MWQIVVGIVVFIFLIGMVGVLVWWFWGSSNVDKCGGGWLWDPECHFFQERFLDDTLDSPSSLALSLVGFSNVPGAGPSLCYPMWYKFKYVNVDTGGYSSSSAWTKSAVQAGSSTLPCTTEVCPFPVGRESCLFNQPVLGISNLQYNPFQRLPDGRYVCVNVHRYVGRWGSTTPPSSEDGDIIGILIPSSVFPGISFVCTDVLYNPCVDESACNRCPNC